MSAPILWTLLLACSTQVSAEQPVSSESVSRVVAIGDLHGDYENAIASAALAGIVDKQGQWIGGTTTFVQTGDQTDRGPDSKRILQWLDGLEEQAAAAGGQVIVLLGNHEVMNLHGDLRYVTPGDIKQFGGLEARQVALSASGQPGKWMSGLGLVAKVGDTIFCHGGLTPEFAKLGIPEINHRSQSAMRTAPGNPIFGETGPLWYRGFVVDDESVACPKLGRSLAALGAKRMVVGHTTRRDGRIETRCSGRLVVIDTGISQHYGGNLSAWVLSDGNSQAIYPSGSVDLEDPKE